MKNLQFYINQNVNKIYLILAEIIIDVGIKLFVYSMNLDNNNKQIT